MAKVLTEKEVADTGGTTTSNPTLCCTASRASALNCNVTSPSGAASNQLITGVSKKSTTPTYDYQISVSNSSGKTSPVINFLANAVIVGTGCPRTSGNRNYSYNWSSSGTVNRISISLNDNKVSYVTITVNGTKVINNLYIGGVTGGLNFNLSTTFKTSDVMNGKIIYISFS